MSAGSALTKIASEHPHLDVLRYEHKNVKWTLKHIEFFSDALATGLVENGLKPGDAVLSWLPSHFSEQLILQFACAKAGFVLYTLDPSQAITDPEGAKASLAKALEITQATVLIQQEAGDDVNYVKLTESVIPETRIFAFQDGMPFFTPRYPNVRFVIQTGFDEEDKFGMLPLKWMLVPSGDLDSQLEGATLNGSTPLMGELVMGKDGLPALGKVLTNEEVVKQNVWPEFVSVLKKDYKEIEGVGVVF